MKKVLLFIIFLFIPFLVNAVEIKSSFIPEEIKIDEYYEGISKGDDEGYVIVGSLANDTLIKKYNYNKELIWSKSYSGSGIDYLYDVEMISDGYVIVGYTESSDIDGVSNSGKKDAYIIKIDFKGELIWKKTFGGILDEIFYDIEVLNDGSYVAVGYSSSKDFENVDLGEFEDGLIVRYDTNGNVINTDFLTGNDFDVFRGISATKDGGYIIVGTTLSTDLEFTAGRMGDGIIYKYNSSNQLEWLQQVGVSTAPILGDGIYGAVWSKNSTIGVYDVIEVEDGYVLVGRMQEQQSSYSEGIYGANVVMLFASILKYDLNGTYLWGRCINDSLGGFYDIEETNDNSYLVVGNTGNDYNPIVVNYSSSGEIIRRYDFKGESEFAQNTSIEMVYNNYFVIGGKYSGNSVSYSDEDKDATVMKSDDLNGRFDSYIFEIDYVYNIENVTEDTNGSVEVERVNGLGLARVNANNGYKVNTIKVLDANNNELSVLDNGDGTYSFPLSEDVRVEVTFMEDIVNPKTFDTSFLIILISLFFGGLAALLFYLILRHDKVSIEL